MTGATLPKLSRPRLVGAVARPRLFELLDQRRANPIIWIASPPGAGKTTLVAGYLEVRNLTHIWYQIDSGDNDPATFFYYLGRAAPPKKAPLPLLTAEYVSDLGGFGRRFFRDLFARMPRPSVLVLDNYQETAASSSLHAIFREAFEEIPEGVNVIIISREPPPSALARFNADQKLGQLQWGHLRLTATESRDISISKNLNEENRIQALYERSDGWAAGLILMLARGNPEGTQVVSATDSQQSIFDYFAGEIFDKAPAEHQDVLMKTAFLPRVTPELATEISGNVDAANVLEIFFRRHYFTDRRDGKDVTYQYHALFRDFLLNTARQTFSAAKYAEISREAADLLRRSGQIEDALSLYVEFRDWRVATEIILAEAQNLLSQGRGETLRRWVDALPKRHITETPWLVYWHGASLVQVRPLEARKQLEETFAHFRDQDDYIGQAVCVAAIVQTYYFEAHDFTQIDKWIPILEDLLSKSSHFPSKELKLAVFTGMIMALAYRQPGNAKLPSYIDHVLALIEASHDANQSASALFFVLTYCIFSSYDQRRQRIVAVARALPVLEDDRVSALTKAIILHRLSFLAFTDGEFQTAKMHCSTALDLAEQNQLEAAEVILVWAQAQVAAAICDRTGIEALMNRMESYSRAPRTMDAIYLTWAKAAAWSVRGENQKALELFKSALQSVDQLGLVTLKTSFRLPLALAQVEAGEYESAELTAREARANIERAGMVRFEAALLLIDAHAALLQQKLEDCHELLRQGLRLAQQAGSYVVAAGYYAKTLPTLWAEALKMGIEVEYVQRLIRKHKTLPAPIEIEHWPWPIKIYTLGRFEILIDDTPLKFTGRTPRQPLQLLKLIISLGGEANSETLCEALWPDAEGDVARLSLETALHRLRKVLRNDCAILRQNNALRLDASQCWIDAVGL